MTTVFRSSEVLGTGPAASRGAVAVQKRSFAFSAVAF
jgi:hypothetical protein